MIEAVFFMCVGEKKKKAENGFSPILPEIQ